MTTLLVIWAVGSVAVMLFVAAAAKLTAALDAE